MPPRKKAKKGRSRKARQIQQEEEEEEEDETEERTTESEKASARKNRVEELLSEFDKEGLAFVLFFFSGLVFEMHSFLALFTVLIGQLRISW